MTDDEAPTAVAAATSGTLDLTKDTLREWHSPDDDLECYLHGMGDALYGVEDIAYVLALVPGHNDEMDWFWVLRLCDGRYIYTRAGCDYTGWHCQAWGSSSAHASAEEAAQCAPEEDGGRQPRKNLLGQIAGTQPYGVELLDTAVWRAGG